MKRRENIIILIVWMFVLITPYIIGFFINDQKVEFLGFLINPIDGLSYLAKMNQGASGEWLFHLPYSAMDHQSVLLFSFYLLIGKISTIFPGGLNIGFHFFRIICAIFFYYQLILFVNENFEPGFIQKYLKIGVLFGGGLGWLYIISGDIPADFWIAEAFPFLSAFVNPHFILSLGILLFILRLIDQNVHSARDRIILGLISFMLANISPFSVVIGGLILFVSFLWDVIFVKKIKPMKLIVFSLGAGPVLLYQYWVVNNIGALASWNSQNITPAPNLLNFIFSFSPILLAVIGFSLLLFINKKSISKLQFVLLSWVIIASLLIYSPLDLQRRFMVGFYLAIILLFFSLLRSIAGFDLIPHLQLKRFLFVITVLIIPSNLLLISGAIGAVLQKNENLFIQKSLVSAFDWLNENGMTNEIVLTDEEFGISLPAYTHQRVVVGHPFETPQYNITSSQVDSFFTGTINENATQFLENYQVDYILFPKDRFEIIKNYLVEFDVCYENKDYFIYAVNN